MHQEIWKRVEGFHDYEISNHGRVKSYKRNSINLLNENPDSRGYLFVRLRKDDKYTHFFIHRLVALMFIPNLENKPQVNHKDGKKNNNHIDNLEWVTNRENQIHAHENGLKVSPMKGMFGSDHNKSKAVIQYSKSGDLIAEYGSIKEAQRMTGIADSNIGSCCRGKYKSAGGFIWKYKGELK